MGNLYRFKVALKYRKGLWRVIEIKGGQTLGEFDRSIREAFDHDMGDHLSEFYRGRVWRSQGYGEIYPGGRGEGGRLKIDALGLSEGDKFEYVYDFGDDVQHIITLEKVLGEEDTQGKYPRVISKNRPRHKYCVNCESLGKKTIATLVCVDCSDRTSKPVFLCEECMEKKHEEHNIDDMVY
ncbi:MAG: hypothetical protein HYY22_10040 [Thaumarchaeota archaeon]|nr:hypothetical protein [Nitrososphaerota archaeon]